MYIKKKDKDLFNLIDKSLKVPTKWQKFVDRQRIQHNLIIKNKNSYHCTNCNFKFESNKKINQECKCPKCKNVYLIKSSKLKKYKFVDQLAIFDKVEDYYVERIFQLESHYCNNEDNYYRCFEWGRNIYNNDFSCEFQIMNDNTVGTTSGYWISYRENYNSNWKYSMSWSAPIKYFDDFIYYPGNLKNI